MCPKHHNTQGAGCLGADVTLHRKITKPASLITVECAAADRDQHELPCLLTSVGMLTVTYKLKKLIYCMAHVRTNS